MESRVDSYTRHAKSRRAFSDRRVVTAGGHVEETLRPVLVRAGEVSLKDL
jgi:hypothetical protein